MDHRTYSQEENVKELLSQKAERQELYNAIDSLPEESVVDVLQYIRSLRTYVEAYDDGFYNPANLQRLDHSIEQLKQGKVIAKTFEELERMDNT
jgi:hypothetical protein